MPLTSDISILYQTIISSYKFKEKNGFFPSARSPRKEHSQVDVALTNRRQDGGLAPNSTGDEENRVSGIRSETVNRVWPTSPTSPDWVSSPPDTPTHALLRGVADREQTVRLLQLIIVAHA